VKYALLFLCLKSSGDRGGPGNPSRKMAAIPLCARKEFGAGRICLRGAAATKQKGRIAGPSYPSPPNSPSKKLGLPVLRAVFRAAPAAAWFYKGEKGFGCSDDGLWDSV